MIRIEERNEKKIVTVERGRGTETFVVNATVSDALLRHIFRERRMPVESGAEKRTPAKSGAGPKRRRKKTAGGKDNGDHS